MNYKERFVADYRVDFIVEDAVVVEIKSVERCDPVFETEVLTHLRLAGNKICFMFNFKSRLLNDIIKRAILGTSQCLCTAVAGSNSERVPFILHPFFILILSTAAVRSCCVSSWYQTSTNSSDEIPSREIILATTSA